MLYIILEFYYNKTPAEVNQKEQAFDNKGDMSGKFSANTYVSDFNLLFQ